MTTDHTTLIEWLRDPFAHPPVVDLCRAAALAIEELELENARYYVGGMWAGHDRREARVVELEAGLRSVIALLDAVGVLHPYRALLASPDTMPDMRLTSAQSRALLADLASTDLMTEAELLERERLLASPDTTKGEVK